MRQKITWFIPGLLVTLLLGLLWAMPAFGAEAGTIAFKNAKGGGDITHVSLNGPAADGGFWFQITDSDLDPVETVKMRSDADGDGSWDVIATVAVDGTNPEGLASGDGYTWHDVQDSTGDGVVDNRDFTAWNYGSPAEADGGTVTQVVGASFSYDRSNGTLAFTEDAAGEPGPATALETHEIRYKVKKTTVIGARNGSNQMVKLTIPAASATPGADASLEVVDDGSAGATDIGTRFDGTGEPESDLVNTDTPGTLTWVELLSSKISNLIGNTEETFYANADDTPARTSENELEKMIADLIKVYNDGEPDKALGVTVTATFVDAAGTPVGTGTAPDSLADGEAGVNVADIVIAITNNPADADLVATGNQITRSTVCLGLVQKDTPMRTGDPLPTVVDADYDCTAAEATTGVVIYDPADVVVEVTYQGNKATVYPGAGRIGKAAEVGRVMVSSNGAEEDISVLLQETGSSSGVFGANIEICKAGEAPDGASDASSYCGTDIPSQEDETAQDSVSEMGRLIKLPVDPDGDTIRIRYRDASPGGTRTATIPLDLSGPAFSNLAPTSGAAGREDEPTVSFQVTDGEAGISAVDDSSASGYDPDSIYVVAGLYELGASAPSDSVVYERDDVRTDEAANVFSASVTIDEGSGTGRLDAGTRSEYEIRWWAVAVDAAGNVGISDRNGDTKCNYDHADFKFDADAGVAATLIGHLGDTIKAKVDEPGTANDKAAEGCDPNIVRVDSSPILLSSAMTGPYLDGDTEKTGSRTSVVVIFSEPVECESVDAEDFTVGGSAPNSVADCKGMKVYLNVDELDPDATPSVVVATGSVTDKAGNPIAGNDASRTVTAADDIPAKLTATVVGTGEGDRPVTNKEITVTVTSDERLKGRPTVEIRRVESDYSLAGNDDRITGEASPTGNSNEWTYKTSITGDDADGLYNVYVTGEDRVSSGTASAGLSGAVLVDHDGDDRTAKVASPTMFALDKDKLKDDKVILFEVDNQVQAPTFTPANEETTDNPNAFIRINFANEGKEYGLAARCEKDEMDDKKLNDDGGCDDTYSKSDIAAVASGPSDVATDFDTSGTVTLVSATFNGNDVTDDVTSRDNVLYLYRPGNLSLGDYKLEIVVTDAAGNEGKGTGFSTEFTVTERQPFKLSLNPGANLVSVPANPADSSIDAVFGSEANITMVVTFDNAAGLWKTATRGSDGMFMGDLDTIDANHGYWVASDGVVDVNVLLASGAVIGVLPPAIPISQGWNLVGVADVAQGKVDPDGDGPLKAGEIFAKDYFANIDAEVVYGYDSTTGVLSRISTAAVDSNTDKVMVGQAYWVYANKAGILIP